MKIDVFENNSYYDNENEHNLSLAFEGGQQAGDEREILHEVCGFMPQSSQDKWMVGRGKVPVVDPSPSRYAGCLEIRGPRCHKGGVVNWGALSVNLAERLGVILKI